jgi:ABC-type uncharacterized transport system auxiliary subunit
MPMGTSPNTVARLAMGTAMIAVLSGCESRLGRAFSELTAPTSTVETVPIAAPATTTVAPAYVLPGAPTYTENSQAANVQTFESIYGAPVVNSAAGIQVTDQASYGIPA